ncbi:hypothetical protein COCCADRAFT_27133 [Bipolaris zeicola 26-R-13]|uniref:Uncharacterized protein n=1 Tax=Cochliobolus carbonum (strain 26-R-13) TaxID=930089 RepID=W6XY00_COCC2|nr:uncharacterized protein COCCADRAFT_27133 [Bipolaris zeicola 26-R-13]EUC32337.1 hypothetical protein COCCADRAFT_27133 [Bipolaris zeicola 26-R-13]
MFGRRRRNIVDSEEGDGWRPIVLDLSQCQWQACGRQCGVFDPSSTQSHGTPEPAGAIECSPASASAYPTWNEDTTPEGRGWRLQSAVHPTAMLPTGSSTKGCHWVQRSTPTWTWERLHAAWPNRQRLHRSEWQDGAMARAIIAAQTPGVRPIAMTPSAGLAFRGQGGRGEGGRQARQAGQADHDCVLQWAERTTTMACWLDGHYRGCRWRKRLLAGGHVGAEGTTARHSSDRLGCCGRGRLQTSARFPVSLIRPSRHGPSAAMAKNTHKKKFPSFGFGTAGPASSAAQRTTAHHSIRHPSALGPRAAPRRCARGNAASQIPPGPLQPLIQSSAVQRAKGGLPARFQPLHGRELGRAPSPGPTYLSVTLVGLWDGSVRLTPDAACHVCD